MDTQIKNIDLDLELLLTHDSFDDVEGFLQSRNYSPAKIHIMIRLIRQRIGKATQKDREKYGHLVSLLSLNEKTARYWDKKCLVCNDADCLGDYTHFEQPEVTA